ncbi:uncharacterized protein LOC134278120 [Saccostrea cucullata]|uniref:uncharacterized protein LOC134278120 n=1 Tax=Saccostrea cuccullata TaxID=36930 RepID=UPI002ED2F6A9
MTATWVAQRLYEDGIITEDMRETISSQRTNNEQNRKLISIILRRGPKAFTGLRKALMKSGHLNLSKLLLNDYDDSTLTEYEKKLASARSLIIDVKKGTNTPHQRKEQTETRCKINLDEKNDVFLTATVYRGDIIIHLRHFIENNGGMFPSKRGATFNLGRWVKFESLIEEIDTYLQTYWRQSAEIQWHIGGGVFVSLTPKFATVDVRHYWKPESVESPIPTKKGVCLNKTMFARLKAALQELHDYVPELNNVELCMFSESHQNQEGMLSCPECTPFPKESKSLSMECNADDSEQEISSLNIDDNDSEKEDICIGFDF